MNASQIIRAIQDHSTAVKIRDHGDLAFALTKNFSCFVEFQNDRIKISCTKSCLENVEKITGLSFVAAPNGSGMLYVAFLEL